MATPEVWREFRFISGKKTLVWKIRQEGETYFTSSGQLDGQFQNFSDRPGDKGKPETKAYVTAQDNCAFNVLREIRGKTEKGYIEFVDGQTVAEQITSINSWSDFLPKNFCSYKPQTSIENSVLSKLHHAGKARYTRKYDGMCHVAVQHTHGWEIYSRRMDLTSERFPEHLAALTNSSFQVGTVLVGEMVCQRPDGTDDFKAISRICRSDPSEARKLVAEKQVPEPSFIIFDILFHHGQDLQTTSYDDRSQLFKSFPVAQPGNLLCSVEYFPTLTPETWEQYAKDHKWEGFVVTDGSAIPGEKFYNFHGDAKRPKGHFKLKPCETEDVVVFATAPGTGKRMGGIGAVFVKQRHPETSKWVFCGKVGSGFTEQDLAVLEAECQKLDIPMLQKDKEADKMDLTQGGELVVEIEYGERQAGTQKFRFPVFMRQRTDKAPADCVIQKLADEVVEEE